MVMNCDWSNPSTCDLLRPECPYILRPCSHSEERPSLSGNCFLATPPSAYKIRNTGSKLSNRKQHTISRYTYMNIGPYIILNALQSIRIKEDGSRQQHELLFMHSCVENSESKDTGTTRKETERKYIFYSSFSVLTRAELEEGQIEPSFSKGKNKGVSPEVNQYCFHRPFSRLA